jgi:predicted GNAT family N-acyltransferase
VNGPAVLTADPALLAQAAALRHTVFVDGQDVPPEVERDGADPAALHAVLVGPDRLVVATGRLLDAGDHARIGRVAVAVEARGTGAGAAVMTALERAARVMGLPRVRLHAQEPVVGFYARLGYRAVGAPDTEAGLAHQWMERDLLAGWREVRDDDAAGLQDLVGGCFAEYPGCVLDLDGLDDWMRAPASTRAGQGALQWVVPGEGGRLLACAGLGGSAGGGAGSPGGAGWAPPWWEWWSARRGAVVTRGSNCGATAASATRTGSTPRWATGGWPGTGTCTTLVPPGSGPSARISEPRSASDTSGVCAVNVGWS